MERVQKRDGETANPRRAELGKLEADSGRGDLSSRINSSSVMAAQRRKLRSLFGGAIQLQSAPVIQLHKGEDMYDPATDDMYIYAVRLKLDNSVVYVGQTELSVGLEKRFGEHLKVHDWSPDTHKITMLESGTWTRFETDCSEQYWIDHFGGKDALENAKNQVSQNRFYEVIDWQNQTGTIVFRGTDIGFPSGWKPAQ